MTDDAILRETLVRLLTKSGAHMDFEEAVAEFPPGEINTLFLNGSYTPWHLLEHLRRTQADILDFIRNPHYQERQWPRDYWPAPDARATPEDWQGTIAAFQADRQALAEIARDPATDLTSRIAHGDGQTILREILVVSDHNAYHIGEFAIMRQVMNSWGKRD